jgi:hypothetical protein
MLKIVSLTTYMGTCKNICIFLCSEVKKNGMHRKYHIFIFKQIISKLLMNKTVLPLIRESVK